MGMHQVWEPVHVSSTKDSSYYYSTYNGKDQDEVSNNKKIMILGGGPNRIGQGIEFDYCCVHASLALKKLGFETIIVNCNPETVSTDYDTSDKLYFEPLTLEDVLSIHEKEKPLGVIAQFGGQTPLNLAAQLKENGVNILGTTPETIDMAEDRDLFNEMMEKLEIPMPESGMAVTVDDALEIAQRIGYPLMVRPSYVLGGRGMEVVYDDESLKQYMAAAVGVTPDRPILIDRFLNDAMECEADAISDGENVFVPAVMEHIELAGIHSGDSACILPSKHIPVRHVQTIKEYNKKIYLISTSGKIAIYDPKNGNIKFQELPCSVTDIYSISSISPSNDRIGLGTDNGFITYDTEKKKFQHFNIQTATQPSNEAHFFYQDKTGEVWIFANTSGVIKLNLQTGDKQHFTAPIQNLIQYERDNRYMIFEDHEGTLWMSPQKGHLCYYDRDSNQLKLYFADENNPASLFAPSIRYYYTDRQQNVWITNDRGVDKISFYPNKYTFL